MGCRRCPRNGIRASLASPETGPPRPTTQQLAGTLAARMGNEAVALAALAALRAKTGRFRYGRHLLWAARIAAVLGDNVTSLSLLRGAFARGCGHDIALHTDMDLSCLSADERYREMMRPKG